MPGLWSLSFVKKLQVRAQKRLAELIAEEPVDPDSGCAELLELATAEQIAGRGRGVLL